MLLSVFPVSDEVLGFIRQASAGLLENQADDAMGLMMNRFAGLATRALIIPLKNPAELIAGKTARFGTPIELDLGRRGIRSVERFGGGYLMVAGPTANAGSFALFKWSGNAGNAANPVTGIELRDLRPEALFAIPPGKEVHLLSDDGGILVRGVECKKLPKAKQAFRSLIISP